MEVPIAADLVILPIGQLAPLVCSRSFAAERGRVATILKVGVHNTESSRVDPPEPFQIKRRVLRERWSQDRVKPLPALPLRDEYVERGAVPNVLKHPAPTFRVVDEDEHRLPCSHCGTLAYPVVDDERKGRECDRDDRYDRGYVHAPPGEKTSLQVTGHISRCARAGARLDPRNLRALWWTRRDRAAPRCEGSRGLARRAGVVGVRESTRSKAMPATPLGRCWRYERADFEAWLQECKQPGRPMVLRRPSETRLR